MKCACSQFPLLINLSNHPYSCWGEQQRKAAQIYGECIDLPFPNINPFWNEEDIEKLSEQYLNKILEMREKRMVTVHVMGELTFCYSMIRKLLVNHIDCISSCAERDVEYVDDNHVKQVVFNFMRFRKYAEI